MKIIVLLPLSLVACGRAASPEAARPAAVSDTTRADVAPASPGTETSPERCPLEAVADIASPEIPLTAWPSSAPLSDNCPSDFDPQLALTDAGCAAVDCLRGEVAPGVSAALVIEGPAGSGRFAPLGLAVFDGKTTRFACEMASTVGMRHLYDASDVLGPLPWLADLDGDGAAELVVWTRLSWGGSESEEGLVPAVYSVDGAKLVRRDARGAALAHRVADAYRWLLVRPGAVPDPCYAAMAKALDGWGR